MFSIMNNNIETAVIEKKLLAVNLENALATMVDEDDVDDGINDAGIDVDDMI